MPAIYEVFGDKAGLIREVFFQGFRMLGDSLSATPPTADPLEALRHLAEAFRRFVVTNPVLSQIMFSRPFADFDPTADDDNAGVKVRKVFLRHIRGAVDAGLFVGDPTDIAHVFFSIHRWHGRRGSSSSAWIVKAIRRPSLASRAQRTDHRSLSRARHTYPRSPGLTMKVLLEVEW
ncbi:TetR-like C-terminal domain-containing protein [Fodinicola feengrottensis]|uniref:TetR-like C-terminal domain-containing protein n=1 Tax=Fodinicola feengrottensis TaxID=435914 RepID=UPI002443538E|nr:TetR-like C-terminal domain-containing protein [Fodinicola feengrottensis]